MDILKAEIAKKRKQLEESNVLKNKKYFKRGELVSKDTKLLNSTDSESVSINTVVENQVEESVENSVEHQKLSRPEVIRRLRERGEPIILFGESELESFQRLRKHEILEPEVNKGFRNDFQEAMEQVDQAYLNELLTSSKVNDYDRKGDVNIPNEEITYEDIEKMSVKLNRGDKDFDMNLLTQFLQFLVQMWGRQLNSRSSSEKMSTKGKMASATYAQTREYLKPLLRKLKNKSLPEDITDSLTEIVKHLLERNYILASDAYLQMAIGNSPWPIGVTMVGIHARTGREKIFSKNVAHVMNDETQRKYIQALKRLMTKCQEYYPTDPSRCVEYSQFHQENKPHL
ncbi:pre-mRNA-splicing factor 18 [Chelonus insularis]|uniref:pre-mRNA-splicing factor 18 n=1 Tax=Chelonus insularis TaxID=460826 RepID=UPI00158ABD52|nr:pre-mRNA-splicing factor 18 [Chelonus insularis]